MRKHLLIPAVLGVLVLGVEAVPAAAQATSCPNLGSSIGNIKVTNTTCKVAKKIIYAGAQGKSTSPFKCTAKMYQGGATVTCKAGTKKIVYQQAD